MRTDSLFVQTYAYNRTTFTHFVRTYEFITSIIANYFQEQVDVHPAEQQGLRDPDVLGHQPGRPAEGALHLPYHISR